MASIWWNFELTMVELTIRFNTEKIAKLQRFERKFELTGPDLFKTFSALFRYGVSSLSVGFQQLEFGQFS